MCECPQLRTPKTEGNCGTVCQKDVFNADECGLFFSMAPDKTIAAEPLPGCKKAKERITFMPCANADGSEKFELMVIGHAWKPGVFKKKTGAELGFDYHANKKAWMTSTLFYDWLRRFHSYVCSSPGRKVLLLIDNCSAHGTAETLPEMRNLRIVYLPPNCKSKVQPMDAGVIAALKLLATKNYIWTEL